MVFDNQARPPSYAFPRRVGGTGVGIFYWLKAPFSITLNIFATLFHFIFRVLRIPFPRVNTLSITLGNGSTRTKRRGSHSDDPSVVAERWVRELEEETGAVCISKAALMDAQGGGDNSNDAEPGPSSRPVRRHPVKTKTLPDFFLGSYDAAVRAAQSESRVLCVIITSEEHDDCPAFRREVLTDTEFVHALTDNRIITWGGDVRDRDGYQGVYMYKILQGIRY
jgi:FAS-associated factor 2